MDLVYSKKLESLVLNTIVKYDNKKYWFSDNFWEYQNLPLESVMIDDLPETLQELGKNTSKKKVFFFFDDDFFVYIVEDDLNPDTFKKFKEKFMSFCDKVFKEIGKYGDGDDYMCSCGKLCGNH